MNTILLGETPKTTSVLIQVVKKGQLYQGLPQYYMSLYAARFLSGWVDGVGQKTETKQLSSSLSTKWYISYT